VCGAEFSNLGYNPPHNTSAYCAHHCGPSAAVKSFARATWGYFSAVCYTYGRALLRETGRPQGLIESCWGGSPIESWSDNATLARCPGRAPDAVTPAPAAGEDLDLDLEVEVEGGAEGTTMYNSMIAPFLGFPIRGAIWCTCTSTLRLLVVYGSTKVVLSSKIACDGRPG